MTLDAIIETILGKEGGFVDHPDDRGGPTRWGVTERVARAHGYQGRMIDLPRTEAKNILKNSYWFKPGLHRVAEVSEAVAVELADTGVNMGHTFPAVSLQRWLNVFNRREPLLVADGLIGERTLEALAKFIKARGKDGEAVLVKALNCSQGHRYLEITEKRPANESFIFGWMKNRIEL